MEPLGTDRSGPFRLHTHRTNPDIREEDLLSIIICHIQFIRPKRKTSNKQSCCPYYLPHDSKPLAPTTAVPALLEAETEYDQPPLPFHSLFPHNQNRQCPPPPPSPTTRIRAPACKPCHSATMRSHIMNFWRDSLVCPLKIR